MTARFRDIPQFTRMGCYHCHMAWDHLSDQVKSWMEDYNLQLNPDFQRGHVWSKDHQIKYVEFKLRGGYGSDQVYFNCPGWQRGVAKDLILVDGLQRITAVLHFMDGTIPAFGHLYDEYEDRIDMLQHRFSFNINDLKTRAEVLQWYIDLNTGGVVHTTEEITKVKELLEREMNNE